MTRNKKEKLTLSGAYSIGENGTFISHESGIELMIKQRKSTIGTNKAKHFLILKDHKKNQEKFNYLSSLYPLKGNKFKIDDGSNIYHVEINEEKGTLTIEPTGKKRKKPVFKIAC